MIMSSSLWTRIGFGLRNKLRLLSSTLIPVWITHFRSQPFETSQKSAVIISPHQDDETLGCGGLIALKRGSGVPVNVIFLTDGRHGYPDWISPQNIVTVRQQEARNALAILGISPSETYFLDQADGSLQSLTKDQRDQFITRIAELLNTIGPEEIYVPHRLDGSGDHQVTYEIVQAALRQAQITSEILQYPIYRLPIHTVQTKKQQAIAAYQSQLPGMDNAFLGLFKKPYEIFFRS
jgi:LmbE family N-acetylglucosaminyl deacetylase